MLILHPEVADRSCADCQRFLYDDTPDRMGPRSLRRDSTGKKTLPMYRPLNAGTPCHQCPKTPTKQRADAVEITPRVWYAYQHYRECLAVGNFPDDALVREQAAVFRDIEDERDRLDSATLAAKIDGLLMLLPSLMLRGR